MAIQIQNAVQEGNALKYVRLIWALKGRHAWPAEQRAQLRKDVRWIVARVREFRARQAERRAA